MICPIHYHTKFLITIIVFLLSACSGSQRPSENTPRPQSSSPSFAESDPERRPPRVVVLNDCTSSQSQIRAYAPYEHFRGRPEDVADWVIWNMPNGFRCRGGQTLTIEVCFEEREGYPIALCRCNGRRAGVLVDTLFPLSRAGRD